MYIANYLTTIAKLARYFMSSSIASWTVLQQYLG